MKRIIVCVCTVILFALLLTGCRFNSCVRVGYIGNSGRDNWSARYKKLDGTMRQTMYLDEETLGVTITTEEGDISVSIYKDDVIIAEIIEDGSHTVNASGKLKVIIEADDHKGSFDIGPKK